MIKTGVINPAILSLLCRVRHTNTLVIADRGFPFWPQVETVDISLTDDQPTVLQVLQAILPNFQVGGARMASEFNSENPDPVKTALLQLLGCISLEFLPHVEFKLLVPSAIGLIRTGDVRPYANIILESA
ncbi:D-ribose pyranase [Tunturibacter psychrotolerans]|uniref:D-ribose pyranase n=1 Tax=Tunturiibacter psychrotolerans TaxID=3069686 RepID=A0AAU7ZK73_9BACT